MSEVRYLDWGKCDWFNPKPTVKRKVYQGSSHYTISMGVIQPGHVPGPHKHDYEQTVAILKGKCDFHVDDEVYTFDADLDKDRPVYNMDIFFPKRTADREESKEVR